ncbi:MAG: hypothetical protein ACPG4Q_01795 [Phycisphaeraceae bacterium]
MRSHLGILLGCLMLCLALPATAKKASEPELLANGEQIRQAYAQMLETLSKEVAEELPEIDAQKKEAFLTARADEGSLKAPAEDAGPDAHKAYQANKAAAEAKVLETSRALLSDAVPLLTSDKLDAKLMKIAILRHGTPAGLAEFAQQSDKHKKLIDDLLADEALMKQVLLAGGANGGEYGEAMQVYHLILEASEKARERGTILHNLALGTALQQPWLDLEDKGSVNAPVFTDHTNPDGQVERYLHYEKAYLNNELDPAFKDFTAWECKYITNDPYTNEELAWGREMLRNFRPDHITNPDHSWRYVAMVKSDFPYCSTRHDKTLGLPQQEALALGGICGRRAFFGRFITRAFGIPARRSTQTGHAAMNMWTPDGWVTRLGAWWSMNWCGPWGGMDFYLESQARAFPDQYMQVARAQWIGDALGEEDVSIRQYGKGGGLWNGLAFYKKRTVVADNAAAKAAADAELANLTAEEARLLGESDEILGADGEVEKIEIPEEDRKVVIAEDGTITVPAVACAGPDNNTDKVLFLDSHGGGMQIHYLRMGSRPEVLRYYVEAPAAGKYQISALVSTVSPEGSDVTYRINRRAIVETKMPYTKGNWDLSEGQEIELREGRNSIQITFRKPNRGISIKALQFKPVK